MTSPPPSDALVFFGATGDLAYKMIFPALQAMIKRGSLNVPVIGVAKAGWTLGGGVEAAIAGPWTAKLEYLYVDLGSATCGSAACVLPSDETVTFKANIVRAGLNYRF